MKSEPGWFFVDRDGSRQGPVTREQLVSLRFSGVVGDDTPTWVKGMGGWRPLSESLHEELPPPINAVIPPPIPLEAADLRRDGAVRVNPTARPSVQQSEPEPVTKSRSRAAYVALCALSWALGLGASIALGEQPASMYAQGTAGAMVAFWAGKLAAKNQRRDAVGIIAFPIAVAVGGYTGAVFLDFALIAAPFLISFLLFWAQARFQQR